MEWDGSWDDAVRAIEDHWANLPRDGGKAQAHCLCGQKVADEIELRVHSLECGAMRAAA